MYMSTSIMVGPVILLAAMLVFLKERHGFFRERHGILKNYSLRSRTTCAKVYWKSCGNHMVTLGIQMVFLGAIEQELRLVVGEE